MLFSVLAVIILSGVSKVAGVTASDLPDCAIECYLDSNQKVGLQLEDYEGRCRAAPFQLAMRSCAAKACNYEEYTFVAEQAQKYCQENFGVDLRDVMMAWSTKEKTTSTSDAMLSSAFPTATSINPSSITTTIQTSQSTVGATATPSADKSGSSGTIDRAWYHVILPLIATGTIFTYWI